MHQGNAEKAEAILAKLEAVAATATGSEAHHPGAHRRAAPAAGMPISAADRAAIDIMTQQLTALVRCLRGDETEALALLTKAAEAEDVMPYEFGPPVPVKPSRELLGEMLLTMNKPAEAQKAFAAALRRAPGRALSLDGLAMRGREERRRGGGRRRQGHVESQLASRGRRRPAPGDPLMMRSIWVRASLATCACLRMNP